MHDMIKSAQEREEAEHGRQPRMDPSSTDGATGVDHMPGAALGSYGRGIYAGYDTYGRDFRTRGSYGRGIYAGHSTFECDYATHGSYGSGIYAGCSTHGLNFQPNDSYARGMEQGSAAALRDSG